MPARRAFTIIELLVVIAIISLLIAILLPSLAGAREHARYARWQGYSHMLQVDPDLLMYYNFEQQGSTDKVLKNRASYDPNYAAKASFEPIDFDMNCDVAPADWTMDQNIPPKQGRWKGKGGMFFTDVDDGQGADGIYNAVDTVTHVDGAKALRDGMTLYASVNVVQIPGAWSSIIQHPYQNNLHGSGSGDGSPWYEWGIYIRKSDNGLQIRMDGQEGTVQANFLAPGSWNFLAASVTGHSNGTWDFLHYGDGKVSSVNGRPDNCAGCPVGNSGGSDGVLTYDNLARIIMGENAGGSERLNGVIDEAAVFDTPLSKERLDETYMVGKARNPK